jgi:fatty acid-binding protein DegV
MRSARCRYLARITGVAIVTDSTSYVPAALVRQPGIPVVPLQIVIGGMAYDESAPRPRRTPSPRRTVQSSAATRVHHGGPEEQKADSAKTKTC